jgi:outer membrane protein OmpA-like peptidoglycan-associated protein
MGKKTTWTIVFLLQILLVSAQSKPNKRSENAKQENLQIAVSNAELGNFPYFRTFPNFYPTNSSDSLTLEQNRVFFFDGTKYFSVDGKVSSQRLNVRDSKGKNFSEFQLIQEFDKLVNTLGGKKIYTGSFPANLLKPIAGTDDIVSLASKHQVVGSAYAGVVEYVIKTPEKEVWVQLHPYSIGSSFYHLLVVEKQEPLLTINTNKKNSVLEDLEKNKKAVISFSFAADGEELLSQSKDELLNIVGVFQAHPDWKLEIDVHNAPVGKQDYTLSLTQKRAEEIKRQLVSLGVEKSAVIAKGWGDTKPLASNDTEKGRLLNTRVEILKL